MRGLLQLLAVTLASATLTLWVFVIGGQRTALGIPSALLLGQLLTILAVFGAGAVILRDRHDYRGLAAAFFLVPVVVALGRELPAIGPVFFAAVVVAALAAGVAYIRYGTRPGVPAVAAAAGAAIAAAFVAFASGPRPASAWLLMAIWAAGGSAIAVLAGAADRSSRLNRVSSSAVVAALAAVGPVISSADRAAAALAEPPAVAGNGPPVVLIVLDTVRADHLELYGYRRDTMPFLARFGREEGVVVERSVANSPTSGSTHASIFTGLYPPRHGAHKPILDDLEPPGYMYPLRDDVDTLAEMFAAAGYWTVGISANFGPLSALYGLDRGFDVYESEFEPGCAFIGGSPWRPVLRIGGAVLRLGGTAPPDCSVPYRRAAQITDRALTAVAAAGDRPFFLFVNYLDAHDPYSPPGDFRGRFEGSRDELGDGDIHEALRTEVMSGSRALTGRERQHFEALYDGELAYLDAQLQRFIDGLAALPSWQDMVVVVTADHGEAFGEHGLLTHSAALYEEMLNVPLIVKPGATAVGGAEAGDRLAGPAQSVDLFPTLLSLAGIAVPGELDGITLGEPRREIRAWSYVWHDRDERVAARLGRELRSVEIGGWKLIESTNGDLELYDLSVDPQEQDNLFDEQVEMATLLSEALGPREPYRLFFRAGVNPESDDTMNRLRALGYVR